MSIGILLTRPLNFSKNNTKEDKKFVNMRFLHMEMSYSYMLKMDADKMSRFPIYRPWTLYLSSSNKCGGSSSSTKTSVNLADENFDFNAQLREIRDEMTESKKQP